MYSVMTRTLLCSNCRLPANPSRTLEMPWVEVHAVTPSSPHVTVLPWVSIG